MMKAEEAAKRKKILVVADRSSKLSTETIERLQNDGHSTILVDSVAYCPTNQNLEAPVAQKLQHVAMDMHNQALLADPLVYINEVDVSVARKEITDFELWDELVDRHIKSTISAINIIHPKVIERGSDETSHVFGLANAKVLILRGRKRIFEAHDGRDCCGEYRMSYSVNKSRILDKHQTASSSSMRR